MAEVKQYSCDVCGGRIEYPYLGYLLRVDMTWPPLTTRRHICKFLCLSRVTQVFRLLNIKWSVIEPIDPKQGAMDWGILIVEGWNDNVGKSGQADRLPSGQGHHF